MKELNDFTMRVKEMASLLRKKIHFNKEIKDGAQNSSKIRA